MQNTTFGGIQGFTRPPSTPWFDDEGEFAGIVHQERNWTYVLIQGAGHRVPQQRPAQVCSDHVYSDRVKEILTKQIFPSSPVIRLPPRICLWLKPNWPRH